MRRFLILLVLVYSGTSTVGHPGVDVAKPESSSHESQTTIEGLVRDIACPIQNHEATATHFNMKCLRACARSGSPLAILTNNGDLYLPISDKMPDTSQRKTLMPFLGKYVQATGKSYERNGTHTIAISKIKERKDVHLTIDNQW